MLVKILSTHDPRAANAMSAEIRLIHARLERWGKWAHDGNGLGYPHRSVTERAGEGGILAGSPRPPTEMPEDVAQTDAAVGRLGVIDGCVIRAYYLRWAPVDVLYRECPGIHSVGNFRIVLKRARWRVGAYLNSCG